MIVSHAFGTSTSRMALRFTFLAADFEPRVATSLEFWLHCLNEKARDREQDVAQEAEEKGLEIKPTISSQPRAHAT